MKNDTFQGKSSNLYEEKLPLQFKNFNLDVSIFQVIDATIKTLPSLDDVLNRVVLKPDFVGQKDIKSKASARGQRGTLTNFAALWHNL